MKNNIIDIRFILFSFEKGGAAIAAAKFHVLLKARGEYLTHSINQDNSGYIQYLKRMISFLLNKLQYDHNPIKHSLNLFSYFPIINTFKENNASLFHLHWINNDTLSVFDLDKIPAGSIITLHDEWLYCGSEHYYKIEDKQNDFVNGYCFFKNNVMGIHWNYIIWRIKLKKLQHRADLIYTVPSLWMMERASQSLMLRNSDIRLLPNPIDVDIFSPFSETDSNHFRHSLGVLTNDIVLVFGAVGGKVSYLKGAHLLNEALKILSSELDTEVIKKIKIIDFGGNFKGNSYLYGFKNISLGYVSEVAKLALLYSSADCVIIPSLVESFGQVAAEALACETPVVCFNYSGLTDIVTDGKTGLLVEPYSTADLAKKIRKVIFLDKKDRNLLGQNGRQYIINHFSYPVISKLYHQIIKDALKQKKEKGSIF